MTAPNPTDLQSKAIQVDKMTILWQHQNELIYFKVTSSSNG